MALIHRLSSREAELLAKASTGLQDKQIAELLGVSPNTLRTYWSRIRQKLGGHTRVGLVSMWIEAAAEAKFPPLKGTTFRRWEFDYQLGIPFRMKATLHVLGSEVGEGRPTHLRTIHRDDIGRYNTLFEGLVQGSIGGACFVYRVIDEGREFRVHAIARSLDLGEERVRRIQGYSVDCVDPESGRNAGGTWVANLSREVFHADLGCRNFLGADPNGDPWNLAAWGALVDPNERARIVNRIAGVAPGKIEIIAEKVTIKPAGPSVQAKIDCIVDAEVPNDRLALGQVVPA